MKGGKIGGPVEDGHAVRVRRPDELFSLILACEAITARSGKSWVIFSRRALDYEGTELLFIAGRSGEEGLELSLGEGRGHGE